MARTAKEFHDLQCSSLWPDTIFPDLERSEAAARPNSSSLPLKLLGRRTWTRRQIEGYVFRIRPCRPFSPSTSAAQLI